MYLTVHKNIYVDDFFIYHNLNYVHTSECELLAFVNVMDWNATYVSDLINSRFKSIYLNFKR